MSGRGEEKTERGDGTIKGKQERVTGMNNQEIKDFLAAHSDERYAAFSASLVPGVRALSGVRIPVLRALAKDIAKGDWRAYLDEATDDTFEETLLQGLVTGVARMPFEEQMARMAAYVRKIDNWSLCDSPCTGFKFVRKHREEVWTFLQPYLYGGKEFGQRFAVVMLLAHFVTDDFIDRVLEACVSVRPSGFYAMMAVAWAVSVCFARYPDRTKPVLAGGQLDDETQNRAIRKIVDSFRVTDEDKRWARTFRRVARTK